MSDAELEAKAEAISRKMLEAAHQQLQGICDDYTESPQVAFCAIMRAFKNATAIRREWTTADMKALSEDNYTSPDTPGDVVASALWARIILADIDHVQPACQGGGVLLAFARAVVALSAASTVEAMFDDDDSIFGDSLAGPLLEAFGHQLPDGEAKPAAKAE